MVTRKASLPYPASPPSDPLHSNPFVSASNNLMVDSSDVPPIPAAHRETHASRTASSYLEQDNPWGDQPSSQLRSDRPLPDFLKPRGGRPIEEEPRQNSLQGVSAALRPGQAGHDTPRSSIDSGESRGFWEDEEVPGSPGKRSRSPDKDVENEWTHVDPPHPPPPSQLPPAPPELIKRKPVASFSPPTQEQVPPPEPPLEPPHPSFASNNPFRRPSSQGSQPDSNHISSASHWDIEGPETRGKGKEPVRDAVNDSAPSDTFSRLNLSSYQTTDQPDDDPWKPLEPFPRPPAPKAAPPPVPQVSSPGSEQPPLIPVSTLHQDHLADPWASSPQLIPSPASFDQSQKHVSHYSDKMLDRGQENGVVSLQDELTSIPNANNVPSSHSQQSLLDDDDVGPPLPARPKYPQPDDQEVYAPPPGPPPSKPPRPSVATASAADLAKNQEDRNETYQIKHFNWFDHNTGRLRQSSMLTQNVNGPCPLLALVNALILGVKDESQAALDDALRAREQVSLGLIIETLMYELVTRGAQSGAQLPDVDELNAFLMRLKTGMNANPRFLPPRSPPPNIMDARNSMLHLPQADRNRDKSGTFESTLDLKLYGAFSVPLLHGWLPEPRSDAEEAFRRSAQTYEDAQALQFGEEELEYKLTRGGLTPEEQKMLEDISAIKNFFKLYPTQLTPYGLESVQESLPSGSFAIMFRNDHFSTIYKHPQSGQLFTLITDAGYAERDEIIWESLVDISGARNEYFSGDFMPVSHDQVRSRNNSNSGQQQRLSVPSGDDAPLSPQEQQEQHDADFAMALQLQEEEEQRQRAENARRRRSGGQQGVPGRQSPRESAGNIPITLRPVQSRSDAPENRPTIPPRASRGAHNPPAVNRPSDAIDGDAPPAYEEAAKIKPYIPPVGSPLHPTYSAEPGQSASSSNVQLTGTSSNVSLNNAGAAGPVHPPGPNAPYMRPQGPGRGAGRAGMAGRRSSAYYENAYGSMPGAYGGSGGSVQQGFGPLGRHGRGRSAEDRDCTVM